MKFFLAIFTIIFIAAGALWYIASTNRINTFEQFVGILTKRSTTEKNLQPETSTISPPPGRFATENVQVKENPPTIQLTTVKTSLKVNETVTVVIQVSSGNNLSIGATFSLVYDHTLISPIQDQNKVLVKGLDYEDLLPIIIPGETNTLLRLTAVTKGGAKILSGNMAEITFQAIKSGATAIKLIPDTQNTGSGSVIFGSKTNINLPTLTKDLTITIE